MSHPSEPRGAVVTEHHDAAYWAAKRAELAYDEGEQGPEDEYEPEYEVDDDEPEEVV